MGYTANSNVLFILSGVPGIYTFEQNPMNLDILPPKQQSIKIETLEGNNVYQGAFQDNDVRVMKWDKASRNLYQILKQYAIRNGDETIPTSYFWDGTIREMQGVPIQVIDVYGVPLTADYDLWNIELQFKPTAVFDKFYKIIKV